MKLPFKDVIEVKELQEEFQKTKISELKKRAWNFGKTLHNVGVELGGGE